MNFYLNVFLVVALSVVLTTMAQDDEARCMDLEAKGKVIIEECDKKTDQEKPVKLLKCYWRDIKKIPIVDDLVTECEDEFPDDSEELFCGLDVLMCALEKLSNKCEPYIAKKKQSNANSTDDASDEDND